MKSYLKLFCFVLCLLGLPMSLWAEDYELKIFKKEKTEAEFTCKVSEQPKLSFNHETGSLIATVSTQDQPVTILFDEVGYIDLKLIDPTSIDVITKSAGSKTLSLRFLDAQTVVVDGVAEGMSSALFSLDGMSVPAEIERNDRQVTFHLNALPQGVYIIRIGQQSFKIIKKS